MRWLSRHGAVTRLVVLVLTALIVSGILAVGRASAEAPPVVREGEPSPQTFIATRDVSVVDDEATAAAREIASLNTEAVFITNPQTTNTVRGAIQAFFIAVKEAATPVPPETLAEPEVGEETTTTVAPETTVTSVVTEESEQGDPDAGVVPPESTTTTTILVRPPIETQIEAVREQFPRLDESTIEAFVTVFNTDVDRVEAGEESVFGRIEDQTDDIARQLLDAGIRPNELADTQNRLLEEQPFVFIPGLDLDTRELVRAATADVVADFLLPNEEEDEEATRLAKDASAAAVVPVQEDWQENEIIVDANEIVSKLALKAINELDLIQPPPSTNVGATAMLAALAVLLTGLFVWRVAPPRWAGPRFFVLLGVLLVLAAFAARVPEFVAADNMALGFLIPAAAFGFLGAILYEPRTATLLAIPMAAFTAITTSDPGFTVYAGAAAMAPIGFVSSVSSRRELRLGVLLGSLSLAPLAGSVSWLFHGPDQVYWAAGWGMAGGLVAGILALGLLPFFENLFRITTTLTLLDLTDRNHPALRLLEERAPGTFNHSILVGTLAGKAARAIGADALLAQAAAYYHDLGKTVEPGFFIENQFGVSNPHDDMDPEHSAEVIRDHVAHGLVLARQYRIPPDVADGIRMHHGKGLMRYFYHKATESNPGVDPTDYRHTGEKPTRKEMAILMLSDAVEGATRALAQHEDPTPDNMRKLVEQVVGEKLDDGQLDESDLTLGDLRRVKDALVDALIGYYHTRVQYPGFPGTATVA